MAFSPAALGDLFRRDKVKDPFGGDDLYDGESRLAGKGPTIALAASGALFLLLGGCIAAIFVTSEETIVAPPVAAIDARLDFAERLAKYQGSAIAALGAKPVSYERLVLWLEQAQKKGVTLAPISQVLIK